MLEIFVNLISLILIPIVVIFGLFSINILVPIIGDYLVNRFTKFIQIFNKDFRIG